MRVSWRQEKQRGWEQARRRDGDLRELSRALSRAIRHLRTDFHPGSNDTSSITRIVGHGVS